jgi:hypothetical protein
MASPTLVAGHTTVQDAAAATTRNIAKPTLAAGDEIFIFVVGSSSATPNIAIAGFTATRNADALSGGTIYVFQKTATGAEPANYAITSSSMLISAIAVAVNNYGGIHADGVNSTGTSATATAPSVTTKVIDCLRISLVATDDAPGVTSVATLAGHTLLATVTGAAKPTLSVQTKNLPLAVTDPAVTSALSASETWTGIALALSSQVEFRATQIGVYAEIGTNSEAAVTQAGIYAEIVEPKENVTQIGMYIEILADTVKNNYSVQVIIGG